MIYAIQALGTDFVKFGIANNVARRLETLQTGNPHELKLLASADWPNGEEQKIHCFLDAHRVRREWFRLSNAAEDVIRCMKAGEGGYERWWRIKKVNGLESRRTPIPGLVGEAPVKLDVEQPFRLARVLEYAKKVANG